MLAGDRDLDLRTEIAPDVPAQIVGDPLRVQQVLVHLVGNAVEFTDAGPVTLALERAGLGLAIVARLVPLMGGTVAVDSIPGHGIPGHGSSDRCTMELPATVIAPPPAARPLGRP